MFPSLRPPANHPSHYGNLMPCPLFSFAQIVTYPQCCVPGIFMLLWIPYACVLKFDFLLLICLC